MPTLDWLNRAAAFTTAAQVPYRLLEPISTHGEAQSAAGNLLIQGDNLEALKALLPFYRGQVKCIFIDPPYNTKSAFEHYDDNLEHSQWLSMMLPRLQLLRELLSEDGSIWVTIDDNEGHYLKVLMDEVFGRGNFVANVVWQKKYAVANDHKTIAPMHDHVLVYRKSPMWQRNLLPRTDEKDKQYRYEDERGIFRPDNYTCSKTADERPNLFYPIVQPNTGAEIWPSQTRVWSYSQEEHRRHITEGFIYWGKDGKGKTPSYKRYKHLLKNDGVVPQTWWTHDFAGHTDSSRKEAREVLGTTSLSDDFITPKPELLISRILQTASHPNDLILDSFLGSGTTAAVAHKMGRRWIGIEMGEHAATHCLPRLQKVVDGEQGGISQAVGWQGGGGFRFMRLGAPIFDADGCIHPGVRFATLAAFIWQQETGTAFDAAQGQRGTPYLGTYSVFDSCLRLPDGRERPISSEISDVLEAPPAPVLQSRTAYYLLFNGILGDKRPVSGNVLTSAVLESLLALHAGTAHPEAPLVVYGEACRLGPARLAQARVVFKHLPYDVKAR